MSTEARKQRRRDKFRRGMSVRAFARTLKQHELDSVQHGDGSFGRTLNLQSAARNDRTGHWHRVFRAADAA